MLFNGNVPLLESFIYTGVACENIGNEVEPRFNSNVEQSGKQYQWGVGNRLHGIFDERTGKRVNFDYDAFGANSVGEKK